MGSSIDIVHYFQVNSPIEAVYQAVSTSRGISKWWSKDASGHAETGALLELDFGPDYQWQAQVSLMVPPNEFELTMTRADPDWMDSTVSFELAPCENGTNVKFYHRGWKEANEHYYISCYCWAMYLRLLKRFVEHGELVDYSERLNV
jgi:uncharacterized protein YndB with AHSA1/START domain